MEAAACVSCVGGSGGEGRRAGRPFWSKRSCEERKKDTLLDKMNSQRTVIRASVPEMLFLKKHGGFFAKC